MSLKKDEGVVNTPKSISEEGNREREPCANKSVFEYLPNVNAKANTIATHRPEESQRPKLNFSNCSSEHRIDVQQEESTKQCSDGDRISDTVNVSSDSEPNEKMSMAVPDRLAIDPLASNSMLVSTDFMDRIENGLTLLKEHGKKLQKYVWKNTQDTPKKTWSSVVTVVLVEARDLPKCPPGGSNGVYCKCRLGTETHKSKSVPKTEQPTWRERFNMHLYEDQRLEFSVWHKGKEKNFMGRCTIDLSTLERDHTYDLWYELECGFGAVHLLLTLSGSPLTVPRDGIPTTYTNGTHLKPLPVDKYMWYNINAGSDAVGEVRVTVHGARGLPLSSLGTRPLVLCVLELDNARVQTHAARAAPDPLWNHTYTFEIMDITSILEVSVQDQSIIIPTMSETLGKVCIPLLRINNGEKRWYALKDKAKKASARGNCPRILLEMHVVWNPIKASLRVLTPKETKYIKKQTKFDIPLIYSNVKFVKDAFDFFYGVNESIKGLFEWDSVETSALALVVWLSFCYCFRLWMAPLAILTPFLYYWITRRASCSNYSLVSSEHTEQESEELCTENDKTLKNRLNALQDMTFTIKNGIDFIMSQAERMKNLTNFTVPYLSVLAMIILVLLSIALYLLPVNCLFMALGIYKFTRKLLNPNRILNNDILDFLSRVPDNEVLKQWYELKVPEPNLTRMGSRRRPPT